MRCRTCPQMNRPQMHEAMTRILNAERSQLQILFDQAPGFIAVLTGKDHTFEMANEAYYRLVGHRDMVGKPALEALPELVGQGFRQLLDERLPHRRSRWCCASADRAAARGRRRAGRPLCGPAVPADHRPGQAGDRHLRAGQRRHRRLSGQSARLSEKVQQLEEVRASQAFQLALADRIRQLGQSRRRHRGRLRAAGPRAGRSRVLYARGRRRARHAVHPARLDREGVASLAGNQDHGRFRPGDDRGPARRPGGGQRRCRAGPRTARQPTPTRQSACAPTCWCRYVKAGKLQGRADDPQRRAARLAASRMHGWRRKRPSAPGRRWKRRRRKSRCARNATRASTSSTAWPKASRCSTATGPSCA